MNRTAVFLSVAALAALSLPVRADVADAKPALSATEEDVVSALMNFGATRAAAEAAVNKGRSATESNDFDPLFRRALKLVR